MRESRCALLALSQRPVPRIACFTVRRIRYSNFADTQREKRCRERKHALWEMLGRLDLLPRRLPTSKGDPRSLTHGAPDTRSPARRPRPRVRPAAPAFTRQSEARAAAAGRGIDREAEPKAPRRGMAARQRIRLPIATPSVRMPTPSAAATLSFIVSSRSLSGSLHWRCASTPDRALFICRR